MKTIKNQSKHNYLKKIIFFSLSISMLSLTFTHYSLAENNNTTKNNLQKSTNNETINLTPLNNSPLDETYTQKIDEESQKIYHKYIANPKDQKSKILSTYPQNYMYEENITVTEDGSNLMVVRGSSKRHYNTSFNSSYNSTINQTDTSPDMPSHNLYENETQYNSTNANSGLYMNVTNPDGSSMNFGAYFNANTNSNQPRRKSSAQIFVDKKE